MAESSEVEEAITATSQDLYKTNLSEENNINQSEIENENEALVENGGNGVEEVSHQSNNIVQNQSSTHEEKNGVEHEESNNSDKVDEFVAKRGDEIVRRQQPPVQTTNKPIVTRKDTSTVTAPVEIKPIPIGDPKNRSKLTFEVVTARVIETAGKKHVAYTIIMKRIGHDARPAVIERRYNDFCFIYECILKSFHPSILGDFMFPKKVLLGNFKAEVISERTEAFHKFLNLMSNCDSLLYSDYFYSFLTSEEHNEAVSFIKLGRYGDAVSLLETIFHIREKLLTASNIMVLLCLCELVACLQIVGRIEEAYAYTQVLMQCFELSRGHPEAECLRVAFLKLASHLAGNLGHDKKPFDRQLSEMRYAGVKIEQSSSMLEIIRDRYIHRASHTSKLS